MPNLRHLSFAHLLNEIISTRYGNGNGQSFVTVRWDFEWNFHSCHTAVLYVLNDLIAIYTRPLHKFRFIAIRSTALSVSLQNI